MKKVKIMLTTIIILAVLGGALAFKVSKFNQDFCTRTGGPGQCTSFAEASKEVPVGGIQVWTVLTSDSENCTRSTAPQCLVSTHITKD